MEYTNLGRTGLEVSRLCLGCRGFGSSDWKEWVRDEEKSIEIIERAIDLGFNFFDTANAYSEGESERVLGKALGSQRDEMVVASKVYAPMEDRPNGQGLSRKHIHNQIDDSLDRLGTEYLDLYYMHRWDSNTPIEETLSAFTTLVNEGKVRYTGASTIASWQFMKALLTSEVHGFEKPSAMQLEYNLVGRHEEENNLPVCRDQDIGVTTWSPLSGGFLTGMFDGSDGTPATPPEEIEGRVPWVGKRLESFDEKCWDVLNRVRSLADEKGMTPAQISVAWLLHKDVVDSVVVGPDTVEHLEDDVEALEISLSDGDIDWLEEPISPVWSSELFPPDPASG